MEVKCSLFSADIRILSSAESCNSDLTSGLILLSECFETEYESVLDKGVTLFRVTRFKCEFTAEEEGCVAASEKERDFGIVNTTVGELGDGLLLRLSTGLEPGVASRE